MQISVSELKLYLKCPRAYKLHEIDGAEPSFKSISYCATSATRKVIDLLHKSQKNFSDFSQREIEVFCEDIWEEEISDPKVDQKELNTIVVQEKVATKKKAAIKGITKKERTLQNIKTWCVNYVKDNIDVHVLYSNVYFQVLVGDTQFCGYIDEIRNHIDLGLQVIIFNTSSQPPSLIFLKQDFLISLYSYAIWQGNLYPGYPNLETTISPKTIPSVYTYYFPYLERYQKKTGKFNKGEQKGNPMIVVSRSKEELLDFEYEILYTVSGIESEFFPMMPVNGCGCSLCPYSNSCIKAEK